MGNVGSRPPIILNQQHFKLLYLPSIVLMNLISKEGNLVLKFARRNVGMWFLAPTNYKSKTLQSIVLMNFNSNEVYY